MFLNYFKLCEDLLPFVKLLEGGGGGGINPNHVKVVCMQMCGWLFLALLILVVEESLVGGI